MDILYRDLMSTVMDSEFYDELNFNWDNTLVVCFLNKIITESYKN